MSTWTPDPARGLVRPIRVVGDPLLRTPVRNVTDLGDPVVALLHDLVATAVAHDGIGISANQIGVDLSVVFYDVPPVPGVEVDPQAPPTSGTGYLINPTVTRTWGDTLDWVEGCLSLPDLIEHTPRPDCVRVEGVDLAGESVAIEASGMLARCLLHETDHLAGLMFTDQLPADRRRRLGRRLQG